MESNRGCVYESKVSLAKVLQIELNFQVPSTCVFMFALRNYEMKIERDDVKSLQRSLNFVFEC